MAKRNQRRDKRHGEALPDAPAVDRPGPLKKGKNRVPKEIRQAAFLAAFEEACTVPAACEASGVGRSTHYDWLDTDPAYAKKFEKSKRTAGDTLIAECVRRGRDGVPEPVGWYKGKPGGTVQRYSDNLLMFLIKAKCPEYRDSARVDLHPHAPGDGDPTGAGERELDAMLASVAKPDAGPKADEPGPAGPAADSAAGPTRLSGVAPRRREHTSSPGAAGVDPHAAGESQAGANQGDGTQCRGSQSEKRKSNGGDGAPAPRPGPATHTREAAARTSAGPARHDRQGTRPPHRRYPLELFGTEPPREAARKVVVVERSHCPKCSSARRSEYWGRVVQKCPGLRADGTPHTSIIRRRPCLSNCAATRSP